MCYAIGMEQAKTIRRDGDKVMAEVARLYSTLHVITVWFSMAVMQARALHALCHDIVRNQSTYNTLDTRNNQKPRTPIF